MKKKLNLENKLCYSTELQYFNTTAKLPHNEM